MSCFLYLNLFVLDVPPHTSFSLNTLQNTVYFEMFLKIKQSNDAIRVSNYKKKLLEIRAKDRRGSLHVWAVPPSTQGK